MKRLSAIIFTMFFLVSGVSFAEPISPVSISYLKIGINQSGEIVPIGDVRNIKLMVYIPKDRIFINASHPFRIERDVYGNEYVVLDIGSGGKYWIWSVVETRARTVGKWKPLVGREWTSPTNKTVVTDYVKRFASMYNQSMESVAKLVSDIHEMVSYSSDIFEYNMDADWVLRNRKGTCDEYTNLLLASLRVLGIPSRAVIGYAYSSPEEKVIRPHSWVEFLTDKGWVEADPTWNELGYVDASHVRIGSFPDSYVEDRLEYSGRGSVEWKKNSETFRIFSINTTIPIEIYPEKHEGYFRIRVAADGCIMHRTMLSDCVSNGKKVMEWYSFPEYVCGNGEEYVFYRPLVSGGICPVTIYDDFGNRKEDVVEMVVGKGPDIIAPSRASGEVEISTNPDSIFYANGIHFGSDVVRFTRPGRNIIVAVNGTTTTRYVDVDIGEDVSVFADVFPMKQGKKYNITVFIDSKKPMNGLLRVVSGMEWEEVVNITAGRNSFKAPVIATSDIKIYFISGRTYYTEYPLVYSKNPWERLIEKLSSILQSFLSFISFRKA